MRKLSTLALAMGLGLSLASVSALAQTSGTGAGPSPGTGPNSQDMPNTGARPSSSDTSISNEEAPPAGSGTRALRPGQNPDGTPSSQSPGDAPQLPGMKGQGN